MAELPGQGTHWVTDRLAERPIIVGNDKIAPRTIVQALQDTVKAHGNKNALFAKINGAWRSWTWGQYYADICKAAKALISLGIKEGDAVSIIGFNSFEWLVADVATIAAGGIAAGIYTTNQSEACKYIVNHSESIVVFCEDNRHLAKFLAVKSDLTTVKAYVVWGEEPNVKGDDIMSWAAFMKLGEGDAHKATLEARMAGLKPSRCCTLIYTSGTTGNPKACMISHDNMVWTSTAVGRVISAGPQDRTISYLPLSHIAAQMLDIVLPIVWASELHFAQPDALRGSLPQTLQEVRPTLFLGVPRVWEKVEAKLREVVRTATGLKKSLLDWALEIGRDSHRSMQLGGDTRWGFTAANLLVWSKVRAQLGFDQLRGAYSAAAPISKDTLEFFNGLNIPVYEIYGMSESSGPQTVSFEGHVKTGTVGPTFPGAETRIDRPDANGDGEICMRGRHIMMGYLNNAQATAETIDKDGWLHSGDVGRVDASGFLAITGRIKELIITAGGENIPPVLIENELKLLLGNVVSNVMVIGDRMKFLSAVFTLQTKPNLQAQPGQYPFFDDLTDVAVATLSALGSTSTTLTAALKDDIVKKYIQDGINKYNNNATSRAQGIRKFFLAPSDFSIEGDELTATMKLKRRVVLQKYAKEIEAMYEGDAE